MAIDWDMYFDEADYASSGGAGNYYNDDTYSYDNDSYFDEADFLANNGSGNYYDYEDYNYSYDYPEYDLLTPPPAGTNFPSLAQLSARPSQAPSANNRPQGMYGPVDSRGNYNLVNDDTYSFGGAGSLLGGLLGGNDGRFGSSDLMGYLGKGIDTYMGKRENDRYNEMMQPMTDLYRAQAADVQNRRDNRDANLAGEYSEWEGLMQPQWDRRDQIADNLRQAQGQTQSSTSAWNRAASEQARDATKLASRRAMSKDYDTRTGILGGQLSALNPLGQKGYLERQENPWLGMLTQGIIG